MGQIRYPNTKNILILAIILIFALYGLWLRLLPMDFLLGGTVQKVIFMDPWFSMRQIEVIVANNLSYPWFDQMSGYPVGKEIDWGPLYPVFSAAIALLLGATTHPAMMTVVSWIPPILSLVMVPIMFFAGKKILDWKAGIIAAILISVISGEYMYRSFFGYLDHHLMEVIFSTAFMVLYLTIIQFIQTIDNNPHWRNKQLIILSIFCGIIYYLGMMNIPTISLFAGIVGLFCFIHAMIALDEESLKEFSVAHALIFGVFIILFGLTGIHQAGFSLEQYTPIHLLLSIVLIIEPIILGIIIKVMKERARWEIRAVLIGVPIVLLILASFAIPAIVSKLYKAIWFFFVYSYQSTYINEIQMWDLTRAWYSFNLTLIFMSIGMIIALYQNGKKYNPILMCALIWGLIVILSTILHLRFEYYAAVIVVLFAAYVLSLLSRGIQFYFISRNTYKKHKKDGREGQTNNSSEMYVSIAVVGVIILFITILSSQVVWVVATQQLPAISMSDDWAGTLVWLEQHSPEPGTEYLKIYEQRGFSYPSSAYGVLAWWDYGHWITYLAKRIPISSPFQNNAKVVAKFLISSDEGEAENLANTTGARYIITDFLTVTNNFPAVSLWATGQQMNDTYQKTYYQQSNTNPGKVDPVITLQKGYFSTIAARLHLFDGSKIDSTGSDEISYKESMIDENLYPIITRITHLTPNQTNQVLNNELSSSTDIVSVQYTHPIITVPALHHYRLVYESPSVAASDEYAQIHTVKIFERVIGYSIRGNGTIELPLITNMGRIFTYRQESTNGLFTVPFSTERENTDVKATGPYQIIQTGETFNVTENQIIRGF